MIEITKADEPHIPELGNLWMEFMLYSQSIDEIYAPADDSIPLFIKDYLRPAMEAENSLVLVALDGGRAVGYSYSLIKEPSDLNTRDKWGCIHDMFVTSEYRNRGIGKQLYSEILRWFHSNGISRVELEVITQNIPAVSFWEKHGFIDQSRNLYRNI